MRLKSKIFITTFILVLPMFLVVVSAQTALPNPLPENWKDFPSIVNSASNWIRPIAIIGLTFIFAYGGYIKLTAAGNPDQEKKAYQIIRAGIIGFLIVVLAPFFVNILGGILGADLLQIT